MSSPDEKCCEKAADRPGRVRIASLCVSDDPEVKHGHCSCLEDPADGGVHNLVRCAFRKV